MINSGRKIALSKFTDIKAEALLVEADYNSVLDDHKLLFLNGGFKRAFRNDIETIHDSDQNRFKVEREIIEVNRAGLYDSFPELLFHKAKKPKQFRSIKDLKEEHQFNDEIEANARRFFWPLDHYLIKMKCHIYAHETGKNPEDRKSASKSLQRFWDIPTFFENSQVSDLSKIMPYAKEISMNIDWMEQTFRLILDMDVRIKKTLKSTSYPIKNSGRILGNSFLGNDTCIGSSLTVSKYFIKIEIGPIDKETTNKFARGKKASKALNFLIETFVPLDFNVEQYIIPNSETKASLDKKDRTILGLTSIL